MEGSSLLLLVLVLLTCSRSCEAICGGELNEDNGQIQSPNYPNNYWKNQMCVWKISVPQDFNVVLTFQSFELEGDDDCALDYVEVRDGDRKNSPVLGRFCGDIKPEDIVSSSNHLWIKFVSDDSVNMAGFAANSFKMAICGGELNGDNGQIQSPNYPNNYWNNQVCVWKISVPQDFLVFLTFQSFEIEGDDNCALDYVEVRDGDRKNSPVLGRFCGDIKPEDIVSSSNHLWIKFKSNRWVNMTGFAANFYKRAICGGELNGDNGQIQSPNYPNNYWDNQVCVWKISVPQDFNVGLTFQSFELEGDCWNDYVEVRDGDRKNSPVLGRFCGDNKPEDIVSSSNHLWIKFVSDDSVNMTGFTANFYIRAICSGELNGDNGQIQSLNYPNNYWNNQVCVWKISVPQDFLVFLTFQSFELQRHDDCALDYVEVRDGDRKNSPVLGRFCGDNKPEDIVSSSNHLWIKFVSDDSVNMTGFAANFYKRAICGGELNGDNGQIQSPNYPNNYWPNQVCVWKISVPQDFNVVLTFQSSELQRHDDCALDYVEVRDGDRKNSPVLGRFCGDNKPEDIVSSSNHLWIKFVSDDSVNMTGFAANFFKTICGGELNGDNGQIQSPNYPNNYWNNQVCVWKISVPQDFLVFLTFQSFELEGDDDCALDYVEVRDGDRKNSPVLGRFCGDNKPEDIVSSSNHLWIKFKSNRWVNMAGFAANFFKKILDVTVTCSELPLIENSSAHIFCNGSHHPNINSVKWLKDGGDLSPGDHIDFSTGNRSMWISPLMRSDAGEYQCRLETPFQSKTSEPITIHIYYGPDVRIDGPDTVYSGERVLLSCSAASEPSASFCWSFNGTDLGVTEDTFLINRSDNTHSGEYSCTATNNITERSVSVSHMLLVKELCVNPPLPEQQSRAEGETAFLGFSCSLSRPPRWFVWSSESSGVLLSQSHPDPLVPVDADTCVPVQSQHSVDDVLTAYEDRVSVSSHNLTLVMRNLTLRDSGKYSLFVVFDDWSGFRGETTLLVYAAAAETSNDTQLMSGISGTQRPGGERETERVMKEPEADQTSSSTFMIQSGQMEPEENP